MMRSLYSGVAGLKTHQTKMDVIGNNIANVNTVSYKSQSVTFNTLLYQTTQTASGANQETGMGGKNAKQIGLGSKTGAISTQIDQAGSAQTTNNPFDIMITGDSFFIVNNGTSNYFTRDGSFYVDGAGNLCMSSTGYNVMGWQVDDETQTIRQDRVSALKIMDAAKMTYDAEATTEAYVSGIVDANDSNINSTSGKVISLLVYDKLGYQYSAKFSMHATADKNAYYMKLEDVLDQNGDSLYEQYKGQTGVTSIHNLVGWGSTQAINTSDVVTLSSQNTMAYTDKGTITMKDSSATPSEYKLENTNGLTKSPADTTPPTEYLFSKATKIDATADAAVYSLLKNAYNLDDDTIGSIRAFS
ncbi:MAG: flagellar hook-basal body complex protein, partial [Lachnospiraceae bacterium]|nr:flagellar hook-basal body complex protein [Lachnospiraceae bacterium]